MRSTIWRRRMFGAYSWQIDIHPASSAGQASAAVCACSEIELVADRNPAIRAAAALDRAEPRERHVVAGDEQALSRRHVEYALARRDRLLLVVVDVELPLRPLERDDVMPAGVGPDQELSALALDVVRHHPRRMAKHVDRADTGRDLVARLDEARAVGERNRDLYEQLAIELARLAHVLAALPEIELDRAEHVARVGEYRLAALGEPADVVGVAVRDDDHIDVGRLVAGLPEPLDQVAVDRSEERRVGKECRSRW